MISRWAGPSGSPCALQVVELLLVELRDRSGVRAAHVVGLDLQPGDRVRVRLLRQKQVPALLERVRLLGAGVHLDHAAPHRARAAAEDAAEREIRDRVRRGVLLQRVEVEVLAAVRDVGAGDARARAAAVELRLHPDLPARRAERERRPVERRVARDDRALVREHPGGVVERLRSDVVKRRALAHDDLGDAVEEALGLLVARHPLLPDLGLGSGLEHDQRAPVELVARRRRESRPARRAARPRARARARRATSSRGCEP